MKCRLCDMDKSSDCFFFRKENNSFRTECKECLSIKKRNSYKANKEKILIERKNYYANNKEKIKERNKNYYHKNKEKISARYKIYANNNKTKNRIRNKHFHQKKYKKDLQYTLKIILRKRFKTALKRKYKTGSAIIYLGCSIKDFKLYLENQFQTGMTWENYGKWHIDHVIPISSFDLSNETEAKEACNYLNLQPLWAKDNLKKSNKIKGE